MVVLVLLALYLGQASRTAANPDTFKLAAGLASARPSPSCWSASSGSR